MQISIGIGAAVRNFIINILSKNQNFVCYGVIAVTMEFAIALAIYNTCRNM